MIFELAQDFRDALAAMPAAHSRRRTLGLYEEAIRRDIHFIARHPTTLFQCLWNTCWWHDSPETEKYYNAPEDGWPVQGPPWSKQTGCTLYQLLEDWHTGKQLERPGIPWVRSLLPPVLPLGSALQAEINALYGFKCFAFSPDSTRIAAAGTDTIKVWDIESLVELSAVDYGAYCMAFLPDGKRIISGDTNGDLRVWDATSGSLLSVIYGHTEQVMAVTVSSDGTKVVSGGFDKTFRVWDAEELNCLAVVDLDPSVISCIDISPDGQYVALGTRDGIVRVWHLEMRKEIAVLGVSNHIPELIRSGVDCVQFSNDGARILAVSAFSMKIWNSPGWDEVALKCLSDEQREREKHSIVSAAFVNEGTFVVTLSTDGDLRAIEIPTERQVWKLHSREQHTIYCQMRISPDRRHIATAADSTRLRFWAARAAMNAESAGPRKYWTPLLRTGTTNYVMHAAREKEAYLYDAGTTLEVAMLRGHGSAIKCIGCAPCTRLIATAGSTDQLLNVWDANTGVKVGDLKFVGEPKVVRFAPHGRQIALAHTYGRLLIWDVGSKREPVRMKTHQGEVCNIEWSPDGGRVVTEVGGGIVQMWAARDGECEIFLRPKRRGDPYRRPFFSADGKAIFVTLCTDYGDIIEKYDVESGEILLQTDNCEEMFEVNSETGELREKSKSLASPRSASTTFHSRAVLRDSETLIQNASTRTSVAWFTQSIHRIVWHPTACILSGSGDGGACLIKLEGVEESELWTYLRVRRGLENNSP